MEIAPGVDLERDILAQCEFPLRVADELRTMDAALFHPEPIGLKLRPAAGGGAMSALRPTRLRGPDRADRR